MLLTLSGKLQLRPRLLAADAAGASLDVQVRRSA
jgi:hypothetical protein